MQKIGRVIALPLILFLLFQVPAFASENVSINQLIEQEDHYDKTLVTVQGEAIGEPLKRGSECWVNLNDGTNAIGIKMKETDAERIQKYGSYKQTGDLVQIKGYFNKACPVDGGETDIHAVNVKIVASGKKTADSVPVPKIIGTAALTILMAAGLLLFWKKRMA